MSGGSYNYIYSTLSQECEGQMHDAEMNDLIKDLCKVLHDLEWWQSCDSSEENYRKTVAKFKEKWFQGSREERLKSYIDEQLGMTRQLLYNLCSIPNSGEPERVDCKTTKCENCINHGYCDYEHDRK